MSGFSARVTRTLAQPGTIGVPAWLNLLYEENGGSRTVGDTADFESEQELQEARDQRLMEISEESADALQDLALLHGCYPLGAPRPVEDRDRFERQQRFGSFCRACGDLMWRVTVPANAVGELRYRLRAEGTDQDTGD